MRRPTVGQALAWAILAGLACMLPRALSYSFAQLGLVRALWGQPLEKRGEWAADEYENPLSHAGAVRTRKAVEDARRAGRLPRSSLPATWRWAFQTGKALSPGDRIFMNTPHFPAYVYGNFFFYPAPLYMESAGQSIVDYETMKQRGRYVSPEQLGTLVSAGFSHALLAPGPGRVRLVELPQGPLR